MRVLRQLLLVIGLCASSFATADLVLCAPDQWMAHYYEHPRPDQFVAWYKQLSTSGALNKKSSRLPVMTFAAELMKQNPDKAAAWAGRFADLPDLHRRYIGWALHNAEIPGTEALLKNALKLDPNVTRHILGIERYDLSRPVASPAELDMLWAQFTATGSEVPVNRIIDVLAWPLEDSPTEKDPKQLIRFLVKAAARWSLGSNVQQHKRVADIVRIRLQQADEPLRKELEPLLKSAQSMRYAAVCTNDVEPGTVKN